jgi:phosphatidate cytidylyltransferase
VLGLVLLWVGWLALVQARAIGINFILSVLCLVWMADVAAYFGGRAFGRRKLAPSISPGKSWEGVWSGHGRRVLLAAAWAGVEAGGGGDSMSLFSALFSRLGGRPLRGAAGAGWHERGRRPVRVPGQAQPWGAKDSSGLLPGHGGVLDRVDALLPVFPLALAFVTL